jgi:hypothetical protein
MGVRNEFKSDLDKGTSSLWHLICPLLPPLRPYAHTVLNVRHHAASTKFPTLVPQELTSVSAVSSSIFEYAMAITPTASSRRSHAMSLSVSSSQS